MLYGSYLGSNVDVKSRVLTASLINMGVSGTVSGPSRQVVISPRSNPFPRQTPPAGIAPAFVRLRRQYYGFV